MDLKKKKVILEGSLGDWALRKYYPVLSSYHRENKICLTGIDYDKPPLNNLVPYIDKKHNANQYNNIVEADFIYIVSKPDSHADVIEHWLGKKIDNACIFVEKPIVTNVHKIEQLITKEAEGHKKIWMIDHYYYKFLSVYPHIKKINQSNVGSIKFNITEPSIIYDYSFNNLKNGVISDLLSHALLPVFHLFKDEKITSIEKFIQQTTLKNCTISKYKDALINNETYAKIHLSLCGIPLMFHFGKGIGKRDNKKLTIKLTENNESFQLDFKKNTLSMGGHIFPIESNPIDAILEKTLFHPKQIWSKFLVSMEDAISLVQYAEYLKVNSRSLDDYQTGDSLSKIKLMGEKNEYK